LTSRRAPALLAVIAALAASGGFAINAVGASAQTVKAQQQQSENWAGYVVQSKAGQGYSSVSGSWTQPSVSASAGQGYSAFWVGLGGASDQSQSLEQVGTSADVVDGQTQYYAWYELVPAAETRLNLAIHPGDHISAKVTVNGTSVTVSLSDQTTGKSVTKTLQMSNPDTSSAEWIAEAPAAASQAGAYQVLPLADFGKVSFTNASATAGGHTGSISDPDWNVQEVHLSPSNSAALLGPGRFVSSTPGLAGMAAQSSAGATPSNLSSGGSAFSVSYSVDSASASSSGSSSSDATGGDGAGGYVDPGYGDPGYVYGDPGYGYGDPGYGYRGIGDGVGFAYVLPRGYTLMP
jgi:hypothetical protein